MANDKEGLDSLALRIRERCSRETSDSLDASQFADGACIRTLVSTTDENPWIFAVEADEGINSKSSIRRRESEHLRARWNFAQQQLDPVPLPNDMPAESANRCGHRPPAIHGPMCLPSRSGFSSEESIAANRWQPLEIVEREYRRHGLPCVEGVDGIMLLQSPKTERSASSDACSAPFVLQKQSVFRPDVCNKPSAKTVVRL